MDELTSSLASTFKVSCEPNSTSAPHPRFSSYKQKTSNNDQESRRRRLLEIQKSNRFNFMNHVRKLTDDNWEDEKDSEEQIAGDGTAGDGTDPAEETMDVDAKLNKPGRYYKDQLMLSEWFVEVPSDFETEWITVLCPVARRRLVVASRGRTKSFTKSGYRMNFFPSYLPGGSHKVKERDTTILDCLYSEADRTFYVLDLMCWNGHPVYDSETEFRFYWMTEKFQEHQILSEISKCNPYKFVPLPSVRCHPEDIFNAIASANYEIDGILFFHKRSHYTFGSTPLVVWLKPYMLPEILNIQVPERQKSHMPEDYTTYANHMKKIEEDRLNSATTKGKPHFPAKDKRRGRKSKTSPAKSNEIEMHEEKEEDSSQGITTDVPA